MFILTAKVPTRIDHSFHYLDIQCVESKVPTKFLIITNEKTFTFGDAGNFSSVSINIIITQYVVICITVTNFLQTER